MALPSNLTSITVTGRFLAADGRALKGEVTFTPSVAAADATGLPPSFVHPARVTAALDATGAFSVSLAATDDPDLSPTGFTYAVTEDFAGIERRTYSIQVPAASPGGTLDLAKTAPAVPVAVTSPYALLGIQNTYTARQLFTGGASLYGFPLPAIVPATKTLWQDSTWRQNFQTGHGWTTGGAGILSSDVNSTAQFIKGSQAVRVTTTGTGVQSQVRKTALPTIDLTGKAIRLTFRVDDVTKLDRIALYVGSGGFANYFQWTFHTHSGANPNYVDSGEWVTVTLHWADVQSAAGTYTLTNGVPSTRTGFTDIQFALYDLNGTTGLTYHLQSIEFIPDATTVFPNGVISLSFDDSYTSVYDLASPVLDGNGQRATTYNIADVVGGTNPAYMTMAQLKATQDVSGWETAGHAYYNASHSLTNGLRDLTEAACDEEFQRLKLWMMRNGFVSDNFAYPKGHFGSTLDGKRIDEIAARYWATSRTIISETMENIHPAMPQKVHARTGMSTTAHVNAFLALGGTLDKIYSNGGWYIICLHKIVTGVAAAGDEINVTDLTTLLNGIASKGVPVRPVGEIVRFYQA